MLNYVDQNSTCMNLLKNNGINISDKNSLKAAASMSAAKADLLNHMFSYKGCVLPSEAFATFGTDSTCAIANNYNLINTKPGVLSADTDIQTLQLQNGKAIYPLNGCLYNINSQINPATFITDAGNVLDQENKAEIARLTQILNHLKAECGILDQNIADTTKFLSDTQTKLANQQALCRGYAQGIVTTNTNINNIKNTITINTTKLDNLKATNNKTIQEAKNMVVKCNRDIRHCIITEHCGQGNFSTVRNLGNSRGRVQKINGYIPNLNIYGFDKSTSSIIIPPGMEVRVFDDLNYLGGNKDFISSIDETNINKIDISCLVNEKYNQNIIRTDNLGNIKVDNEQKDLNDRIRSIRVRRAQEYSFNPTGVIEAYTNYEDKVDAPLIYKDNQGSIDPYFYNPVNASVFKTSDKTYLAAYTKKDGKKVQNSIVTSTKSYDRNNPELQTVLNQNPELQKVLTQQQLEDIPLEKCAKACDEAGDNCGVFTFNPSTTSCDLRKSQGGSFILMNAAGQTTYIKQGVPVQDNILLPDGPYQQTSDLNSGIYDGTVLQISATKNNNTSKMNITKCKPNTIINDGELKCTSIYADGLSFKIYNGYFNDNISFININTPIIKSGSGVLNATNINTFTNNIKIPNSIFTIEWIGLFKANETGSYQFWVNSDDASYLWIGDSVANATIDNALAKSPGLHPMVESTGLINLEKDQYYDFRVVYGQNGGQYNMILSFKPPGKDRISLGNGYFYNNKQESTLNSFVKCSDGLICMLKDAETNKFLNLDANNNGILTNDSGIQIVFRKTSDLYNPHNFEEIYCLELPDNTFLRHSGYVVHGHRYVSYNFEYSWIFLTTQANPGQYVINNYFGNSAFYLGYNGKNVLINTDSPPRKWILVPIDPQRNSARKSVPACPRPVGWCTHRGSTYSQGDCLGDGLPGDHFCQDTVGNKGSIKRSDNCTGIWPNAPKSSC